MKIFMPAVGTTGDLNPFLALGRYLVGQGHEVRFGVYPDYRPRASEFLLDVVELAPDLDSEFAKQVMDTMHRRRRAGQFRAARTAFREMLIADWEARFAAGADYALQADLVIGHEVDYPMQLACLRTNTLVVNLAFSPLMIATRDRFALVEEWRDFGDAANLASWRCVDFAVRNVLYREAQVLERKLGLGGQLGRFYSSSKLNLVAVSPHLAEVPSDLPKSIHFTGYLPLREPPGRLSPETEQFLQGEEPVVLVTMGSMGVGDGARVGTLFAEAILATGAKALIQRGWGKLSGPAHARVLYADYIPHERVFPRVQCIIHHGGAGTTASAATWGIPQIVVPVLFDQFYWGAMVERRGLGPQRMRFADLEARGLSQRIQVALSSPLLRRTAEGMGSALREEDGFQGAWNAISQYLGKGADLRPPQSQRPRKDSGVRVMEL